MQMLFRGPAEVLFKDLTDESWLQLLIRSVSEPIIDAVEMPRFPHGSVQRRIGGSADDHTLKEMYQFYIYTKRWCSALGRAPHWGSRLLDFGCGWGRCSRLFWKEVSPQGIFGVDVSSDLIATCEALGSPGSFFAIEPRGRLPFEDQSFDVIIAYSVFTHLPEDVAGHWIRELARTARPGCVFALTVEPRRFLEFIGGIPADTSNDWYSALARFKPEIPIFLKRYDDGLFCYLPTGGGEKVLHASVYGDAAIPVDYIKDKWGGLFEVRAFIDNANAFWQAFVVLRRP
jgi:SAM-dependent methyltransferase